ncbi:hypothetical protein [Membranihabitans marinus]|uniref:hypothetical protein n=1 Tax=Membranihabitans marinus TaxID=1227546 RepID=UPI001F363EAF|nr:hypothetical protein [Membranihabitans marinus]
MNNRWVVMEKIILWDDIANVLLKRMSSLGLGSVDLRYVLCALLVKVLGKDKSLL